MAKRKTNWTSRYWYAACCICEDCAAWAYDPRRFGGPYTNAELDNSVRIWAATVQTVHGHVEVLMNTPEGVTLLDHVGA